MAAQLRVMYILGRGGQSEQVRRFRAIAEFLGITNRYLDVKQLENQSSAPTRKLRISNGSVLDLVSLTEGRGTSMLEAELHRATESGAIVLLLVTSATRHAASFIDRVTGGRVGVSNAERSLLTVHFPGAMGTLQSVLARQSFRRWGRPALVLSVRDADSVDVGMQLDADPVFVAVRNGKGLILIWSTPEVFDIARPLHAELSFEEAMDEYVPAIVFLRMVYGEECWHNPNRDAGFVIDDPLLRKRYGFIEFPSLLRSARQLGYRVTLAYIPWNYRRTNRRDSALFREYKDCFGVCVHGCDHSNNEYGVPDYAVLRAKSRRAMDRMAVFAERTGIDFEPIVVCPQEQCSSEGWRAFADTPELLAMVNTGCMPRNLPEPEICAADLLAPAQDKSFGFPIFKRHYGGDMAPFAMALFLGKPAILVEHHDYFRNGNAPIEAFVSSLRKMAPETKWRPLSTIARESHLRRTSADGTEEIRFFTRHFDFTPSRSDKVSYRLRKQVQDPERIKSVSVNGMPSEYSVDGNFITLELAASGNDRLSVSVEDLPVESERTYSFGFRYHAGVALRRGMSEFRDNVLARSPRALSAGRGVLRRFGLTGKG